MKGVDYTKQLAKERDYFQDSIKKNKDATDRRISDTESRNEYVQKKQADNFIEDKAELEKSYQKNLNDVKERTHASLSDKNQKYNANMAKEREAFERESNTTRKEFDQRLHDIKSGYDKSSKTEKEFNQALQSNSKSRYIKNIQDQTQKTSDQLNEYQNKMSAEGADLKGQYNLEREQLVRAHEDHVKDVRKLEVQKQTDLKDRVGTDLRRSKEVHAADHEHMRNYTEEKLDSMQQMHEGRSQKVARDYSQKNANLTEAQLKDAKRVNREQQDKVLEVQRGFDKQLRSIELEKRRRDNGSGEFASVNTRQQGLKDKEVLENKLHTIKSHLQGTQKAYQEKAAADQKSFDESFKIEAAEAQSRKDKAVNTINADKVVTVAKERENSNKEIAGRELINKNEKIAGEQQLMLERTNAGDKIASLKDNFNTSMMKMEERLKLSVEDVTAVSNKDKADFVKAANEARTKEIFELKREFTNTMDQTVQGYEKRLASFQRENNVLKQTMDQKVQNIIDQSEKKLDSERELMAQSRIAERQDTKMAMDMKEKRLRKEMDSTIYNYQSKLDKLQIDGETKLKLVTNDYENRLKELNVLKTKELAQKDTARQNELQVMKSTLEEEKTRIVNAYEGKIQGILARQEDEAAKANEYKKLS